MATRSKPANARGRKRTPTPAAPDPAAELLRYLTSYRLRQLERIRTEAAERLGKFNPKTFGKREPARWREQEREWRRLTNAMLDTEQELDDTARRLTEREGLSHDEARLAALRRSRKRNQTYLNAALAFLNSPAGKKRVAVEADEIALRAISAGVPEEMRRLDEMAESWAMAMLAGGRKGRAQSGRNSAKKRSAEIHEDKHAPICAEFDARLKAGEKSADIIKEISVRTHYPERYLRRLINPAKAKRKLT